MSYNYPGGCPYTLYLLTTNPNQTFYFGSSSEVITQSHEFMSLVYLTIYEESSTKEY